MFSIGFRNKAMVISATDVSHLTCSNVENLRFLFIQSLNNPFHRLILDFKGIESIDTHAMNVISRLYKLASEQGVAVLIENLKNEPIPNPEKLFD
jgi:MFS superfamily sulfate permease-like transporter